MMVSMYPSNGFMVLPLLLYKNSPSSVRVQRSSYCQSVNPPAGEANHSVDSGSGPMAPLSQWLSDVIDRDDAEGFFRPYVHDMGGVAPEAWHLSYRPRADAYKQRLPELLQEEHLPMLWSGALGYPRLALLDVVQAGIQSLAQRYLV